MIGSKYSVQKMLLILCLLTMNLVSRSQPRGQQLDSAKYIQYHEVMVKPKFQDQDADRFPSWVAKQVVYPKSVLEDGIVCKITLSFVIGEDGAVRDAKVLKEGNKDLDNEFIRVISESPKWTPGEHNGKKVSVRYVFPINITLSE